MPITFEQPVPIGQAGVIGQVQQYNQDRQYQLQQAALQQHAALARQQQAGQMAMAQAQMSLRAQEANAAQRPSDRDVFLADQHAGMQQAGFAQQQAMATQHLAAQRALQEQDWTHAEELQLQQARQAKAALMADDSFSDEEKALGAAQLDARINPWQAKKERTVQKQRDLQTKEMMESVAQQETIRNLNQSLQRGEIDKLPLIQDPISGASHRMLMNAKGEWYDPFKGARPKDAKDTGAADAEKAYQADLKTYFQEYHKAAQWLTKDDRGQKIPPEHSAVEERLKEMGVEKPTRQPKPGIGQPPGPVEPQTKDQETQSQQYGNAYNRAVAAGHADQANVILRLEELNRQYPDPKKMPAEVWANYKKYAETVKRYFRDETAPAAIPVAPQQAGPPEYLAGGTRYPPRDALLRLLDRLHE